MMNGIKWNQHKWLASSLIIMALTLVGMNFLMGNKPIVCRYQHEWYWPALKGKLSAGTLLAKDLLDLGAGDFSKLHYQFVVWPLLHKDPQQTHTQYAWLPPGAKTNEGLKFSLGTYELGKDVLSGCLTGFSRSMWLALLSMFWSIVVGSLLGSWPVYQSVKLPRWSIMSIILLGVGFVWLAIVLLSALEQRVHHMIFYVQLIAGGLIFVLLSASMVNKSPQTRFSSDRWSLAYLEIFKSIPAVIFLLILIQLFPQPGLLLFSLIIAFLYTPIIVKYSRAFAYNIMTKPFLEALTISGASNRRIYFRHVLPMVFMDLFPIAILGMANIILLETSLSFLGLGFSVDTISLGSLLQSARSNPSAWWVVLFPGALIFWMVFTLQSFGKALGNSTGARNISLEG